MYTAVELLLAPIITTLKAHHRPKITRLAGKKDGGGDRARDGNAGGSDQGRPNPRLDRQRYGSDGAPDPTTEHSS